MTVFASYFSLEKLSVINITNTLIMFLIAPIEPANPYLIGHFCTASSILAQIKCYNIVSNQWIRLFVMNFSDFDVARRTRKRNFLNQIDHLADWKSIENGY